MESSNRKNDSNIIFDGIDINLLFIVITSYYFEWYECESPEVCEQGMFVNGLI